MTDDRITEAMVEAAARVICCGDNQCHAAEKAHQQCLSPDGYAKRWGCESDDQLQEARAALRAALAAVPKPAGYKEGMDTAFVLVDSAAQKGEEEREWKCKAQRSADPPQDCDWPFCGCDPYAGKIFNAIEESGYRLTRPPFSPATWNEAVEACAIAAEQRFAEVQGHAPKELYEDGYSDACADCAKAIRALTRPDPAPEETRK